MANIERDYELLIVGSFARQFVAGKSAFVVGGNAHRVASFISDHATLLTTQNTDYASLDLPVPHEDASFEVVIALGVPDAPEIVAQEARRILKPNGIFLVSAVDNADYVHEPEQPGLRADELRELLGQSFRYTRLYRLGAVAGSILFEENEPSDGATVESVGAARSNPYSITESPLTSSILAVGSNSEIPTQENPSRVLIDLDRRLFEELEELSEETVLLRGEIERMQESEAQSFQDTLTLRTSEVNRFRSQLERSEERVKDLTEQTKRSENHAENLKNQLHGIQTSRTWRLLGLYRSLATRLRRT